VQGVPDRSSFLRTKYHRRHWAAFDVLAMGRGGMIPHPFEA